MTFTNHIYLTQFINILWKYTRKLNGCFVFFLFLFSEKKWAELLSLSIYILFNVQTEQLTKLIKLTCINYEANSRYDEYQMDFITFLKCAFIRQLVKTHYAIACSFIVTHLFSKPKIFLHYIKIVCSNFKNQLTSIIK